MILESSQKNYEPKIFSMGNTQNQRSLNASIPISMKASLNNSKLITLNESCDNGLKTVSTLQTEAQPQFTQRFHPQVTAFTNNPYPHTNLSPNDSDDEICEPQISCGHKYVLKSPFKLPQKPAT